MYNLVQNGLRNTFLMILTYIHSPKYLNFRFKHFWISAVLHFVSQWACLGETKLWHFLPFGDFRDFSWWVTQTCIFQFPSLSDMSWGLTGFNSYWNLVKTCQRIGWSGSKIFFVTSVYVFVSNRTTELLYMNKKKRITEVFGCFWRKIVWKSKHLSNRVKFLKCNVQKTTAEIFLKIKTRLKMSFTQRIKEIS